MSHLIKPVTSDHDLIELSKTLGVHLNGILEIQEITKALPKKGSYLILLRDRPGVGHWVCVHDNTYFDPIGIGPPRVLGPLRYNEVQYQGTYSEYCGIWSSLWLYCRQHSRMDLLKGFTDLDIDAI